MSRTILISGASSGFGRETSATSRQSAQTQVETAAPELDWLNKGVFISVGARQPGAVIYETYLVG